MLFIWRRNEKDDDGKGLEDKNFNKAMCRIPLSLLMLIYIYSDAPVIRTVTPINPNSQTSRGNDILARVRASSSPMLGATSIDSVSTGHQSSTPACWLGTSTTPTVQSNMHAGDGARTYLF